MGPLNRFLTKTFHLRPHDLANLSFLYFATFVMRAAAFAGVAVMQHAMGSLDSFWKGVLFAVYPLAEITTVGYFGALCDRLGRKRILVLAHFVTAVAVVLFIPSISDPTPVGIRPYLVALFFAMFGIGAAAKIGVAISTVLVLALVRETDFTPEPQRGTLELLRTVLRNPDIRRLLPVYVPVVALYGYVLTFTDHLIGSGGTAPLSQLLIVVGSLGVPLGLSLAVSGRWSDRTRRRRPFMGLGLACFGGLAILLAMATGPDGTAQLASQWPLIAVLAAGAGTFPPAALAYLGDIVERAVSGTTFGIYSIIFGTGLIIGPILGGALTDAMGSLAFAVIALTFIGISATGVLFIREPAAGRATAPSDASAPPENG